MKEGIKMDNEIRPYLIQSGCFLDVKNECIENLDSLVDLKYMGASEFEWGALPKNLAKIRNNIESYDFYTTDIVAPNGNRMRIYCKKDSINQVVEAVYTLIDGSAKTHEYCSLRDYMNPKCCDMQSLLSPKRYCDLADIGKLSYDNFWWDIEEGYFLFFDRKYKNKLKLAMERPLRRKMNFSTTTPKDLH